RALPRDLLELGPLLLAERPTHEDPLPKIVEPDVVGLALLAIANMHAAVVELHAHVLDGPAFAPGVQQDRHRRTRSEGAEQQLIRARALVGAAILLRLVGDERLTSNRNLLPQAIRALDHHRHLDLLPQLGPLSRTPRGPSSHPDGASTSAASGT